MATDNFCLRKAIVNTFSDSDVLLSKVAQNDALYNFGGVITRRSLKSLASAQERFFQVLEKWYFITAQGFLQLALTLISLIRSFSQHTYLRQLAKFGYRGDMYDLDEETISSTFKQEFDAGEEVETLDDIYKWCAKNKDKASKLIYTTEKGGQFRDSEFLKLLLRVFAGMSHAYYKYQEQNPEYTWPFTEDSEYFDFRMTEQTHEQGHISLSYDNVTDTAVNIFSDQAAAIGKFRKMLFFSGADDTANIEFCKIMEVKKNGNPQPIDFRRELDEYLEKKIDRCPGTYDKIYTERMHSYEDMTVPRPNFTIVYKECALIEGELQEMYKTPPGQIMPAAEWGSKMPAMELKTPVAPRTTPKVVVETNTGGILVAGGILAAAVAAIAYS